MIYSIAFGFLGLLVFSNRYGWWKKTVPYSCPRILMYHQIAKPIAGARFNGLRVSPEMFDRQLAWLVEQKMNFVTMKQLIAYGEKIPQNTVAITFDDGYEDNLLNALPILKKYHACATLYLVIDRHDNDWSTKKKYHHNSGELAREKKLTDEQVKVLIDSGLFEVAAHTHSHANLSQLDLAHKTIEIAVAKKTLEQCFNIKVSSFAYPFGIYDASDVEIVKNAGYISAVTTISGIDCVLNKSFELMRIKISGKDGFYAFKLRMRTGMRGWKK